MWLLELPKLLIGYVALTPQSVGYKLFSYHTLFLTGGVLWSAQTFNEIMCLKALKCTFLDASGLTLNNMETIKTLFNGETFPHHFKKKQQ